MEDAYEQAWDDMKLENIYKKVGIPENKNPAEAFGIEIRQAGEIRELKAKMDEISRIEEWQENQIKEMKEELEHIKGQLSRIADVGEKLDEVRLTVKSELGSMREHELSQLSQLRQEIEHMKIVSMAWQEQQEQQARRVALEKEGKAEKRK